MKKKVFGLGALALTIGLISMSTGSALAYRGDPNLQGPNYSPERHQAMEMAFENNDYTAWQALMKNAPGRVTAVVTQENFAKFAEMHRLVKDGKFEEAKQIHTSLGLGLGAGPHDGAGKNMHRGLGR